ncbi:MAG: acetamidase/formamidase family protein [Thaumarchaeota archaeon]|nr:acetamidase/formamidase family protein [Nitrososphaerota archaeon]
MAVGSPGAGGSEPIEFGKRGDGRTIRIRDHPANIHNRWSNQIRPVVEVTENDVVVFECRDGSDSQMSASSTAEDVTKLDFNRVHALSGPVFVKGAQPGDALEVEVLDVIPRYDYGWTAMLPGFGLVFSDPNAAVLDDPDFQGPYFKLWRFSDGFAYMNQNKVKVPVAPFMGIMGVAPARKGVYRTIPPFEIGGNFDIRQLTKGSRVFFPVFNEGGLFSTGDAHAAQGDGEVCLTAIEIAGELHCRFRVHKNWNIPKPRAIIPPQNSVLDSKGYYLTMGIGGNTNQAAREAVKEMVDWLMREHNLTLRDAYVVSSVAGDLKLSEVVDGPNWTVSFTVPKAAFLE